MRYKRSVLIFSLAMALFVATTGLIWKLWTENLLTDKNFEGGDLARMAYIPEAKSFRKNQVDLPRRHIRMNVYHGEHVDLVTIGDSFSQGGGGGKNRFYQDYIASNFNLSVLGLDEFSDYNHMAIVSLLLNNGFLEQSGVRFVLIGATERGFRDLAVDMDFDRTVPLDVVKKFRIKDHFARLPKVFFINNGNFKFLLNKAAFLFRDHGFFSDVHVGNLSREFFSGQNGSLLLYLPTNYEVSPEAMSKINDNMNILADRLNRKGIQLIYMPYVEKYTLYCCWLQQKKFPESQFFELLRPLPKRYAFIDTKKLLRDELEKGEMDIFHADDAHSSWNASRKIFSVVKIPVP